MQKSNKKEKLITLTKAFIFISYIAAEKDLAKLLDTYLRSHFHTFIETFTMDNNESISLGTDWFNKIKEGIKSTDILIVLCSKNSISRPWINIEAGAGMILDINVIPVCHTNLIIKELPQPYNRNEAVKLNTEEGFRKIIATIWEKIGGVPPENEDFSKIIEQVKNFEQDYKNRLEQERPEVNERLEELNVNLEALTIGIAQLELREKTTVIKSRAEKFKLKTDKYEKDEVILLIGDSTAGIPLLEFAPPPLRGEYIKVIKEAIDSLEYIENGRIYQKTLIENLTKDLDIMGESGGKAEITAELKSLIDECSYYINEKSNVEKL